MPRGTESPRSVSDLLLDPAGQLFDLVRRAEALQRIESTVQEKLSPEVRDQVRVANLRKGVLHLVVASASIATRLRHDSKSLLQALQDTRVGETLKGVKVKVAPASPASQAMKPVSTTPSGTP